MSREDVQRIAEAALKKTVEEFGLRQYAVVVIVRELPFAGLPINVATNITSGAGDVLRVVREAVDAIRGGA